MKFLSEWLQHWHERDSRISKEVVDCVMGDMEDNDYICSESDSDSENKHEKAGPKNVLLVTGPIGVRAKNTCYKVHYLSMIIVSHFLWSPRGAILFNLYTCFFKVLI